MGLKNRRPEANLAVEALSELLADPTPTSPTWAGIPHSKHVGKGNMNNLFLFSR